MELQGRLEALKGKGLGLAAVSYDRPEVLADFARRRNITFPLLSDPDSRTIKAYGILNTTIQPGSASGGTVIYGIPFPGTFVINHKGEVTVRHFEEAYQERATVSTILLEEGGVGKMAAVQHSTNHLEIKTSASDETIALGTVVSLLIDVKPNRGIHVYAPGATSYKVIALRLDPLPGLKVRPVSFPLSEIYHFAPLNESVPVYQKPFRLVQELNVETSREGQALLRDSDKLIIKGSFDYQACDDKACFRPESIPVEWTFNVRKLDRERAPH